MRCLSPHAGYSIQVFEGDEQIVVDARGHAITVANRKPEIADFEPSGLLDHEIEAALECFNFSGLPEGVNPLTRIGIFDTESYGQRFPQAERESKIAAMDARLRELQERFPSEFVIVDQPDSPKPWPSYDEDSPEEIIAARERFGFSPELVRLYEVENENRQEIIESMWRLEDPEGAEEKFGPDEEKIVVSA